MKKRTWFKRDSMIKHVNSWQLIERMRSPVSIRSVPGATIKSMIHHIEGCFENTSPDHNILDRSPNDLKSNNKPEEIDDKTLNLAVSVNANENHVFISSLVIRNNKLNNKGNR